MRNLELIDDYLSNRLSEQERKDFEQKIESDAELKAELATQRQIVEGIKKARAAELKSMLAKVSIESTPTVSLTPLRIAAGLFGAAVLASVIYYFYDNDNAFTVNNMSSSIVDSISEKDSQNIVTDSAKESMENKQESQSLKKEAEKEPSKPMKEKTNNPVKPAIEVIDPSNEISDNVTPTNPTSQNNISETPDKVEVEVDETNRKYNFHYQFQNGKLRLYGSFKNGLYEIIEINSGKKALFLYYRDGYYFLDEYKSEITPLELIKDETLLKKLKAYRVN